MKSILDAPFIKEMSEICDLMYEKGWNERNGGNISYLIPKHIAVEYEDIFFPEYFGSNSWFPLKTPVPALRNKFFLVTGTGSLLRNVSRNPKDNLVIIRVSNDGKGYNILWGKRGAKPTSEISAHLMCHEVSKEKDYNHRAIIHTHATNLEAMTFVADLNDKAFSNILWKMQTESLIVFPEGVGVLPWMVCGGDSIGKATAEKMQKYRLVLWAHHGVVGSGKTLEETFGLIETAEKAAEIYIKIVGIGIKQSITAKNLKELAVAFDVKPNWDFIE